MRPRKRLVLAAVLSFVVGLVTLFPARVAYQWFVPPGVAMSGIDGTLWSGSAANADLHGFFLRDVKWDFKVMRLVQGRLAYTLDASPATGFITSEMGIGVTGSLYVNDLRGSLPLQLFSAVARVPGLSGLVNADVERLTFADGRPVAADGTVQVDDLLLPLVSQQPLGAFRAEFVTQDDGIAASVQDTQAVIDLVGRLRLMPDRQYEFLGHIAAVSDTPEELRRQLQFLGSPNDQGQHELRLEGVY